MPMIYKVDVLSALKSAGYNTTKIRKEGVIGEAALQHLRRKEKVSWDTLTVLCKLLNCQPGDLLEYVSD